MLACARQVHPRALPGEPPMAAQYLCAKMYEEFAILPEVDEMGSSARYVNLHACIQFCLIAPALLSSCLARVQCGRVRAGGGQLRRASL